MWLEKLLTHKLAWVFPWVVWGVFIIISLTWNFSQLNRQQYHIAHERVKMMAEMVAMTKINPQVMISATPGFKVENENGISYRVVSNNPENSNNRSDEWERSALNGFKNKDDELFYWYEAGDYYRYIKPVIMENRCLSCHEKLGYKVGDIRGGISIRLSADTLKKSKQHTRNIISITHIVVFILLGVVTHFFIWTIKKQWQGIKVAAHQLTEKQHFLFNITDSMGEGCIVLNGMGNIVFVNSETLRLLAWTKKDMLHKNIFTVIYDQDVLKTNIHETPISKTLNDNRRRRIREEQFLRKDGEYIKVCYTINPTFSIDEHGSAVVITFNEAESDDD